jgi:hypothetical protein
MSRTTTERSNRQSRRYATFLQLNESEAPTITASDRTSRHVAAPILLPESDMAYGVAAIAIYPVAAIGRMARVRYAG